MLKWSRSKSCSDAISNPTSDCTEGNSSSERQCRSESSALPEGCTPVLVSPGRQRRPKKLRVRISDKVSVCDDSSSVSTMSMDPHFERLCSQDEGDRCSDLGFCRSDSSSDDSSSSSELSCCGSDLSTTSTDSGIDCSSESRPAGYRRTLVKKTTPNMRYTKNDKMRSCDKILPKSRRTSGLTAGSASAFESGLALHMYGSGESVWGTSLAGSIPSEVQQVTQTKYDITPLLQGCSSLTLDSIKMHVLSSKATVKTQVVSYGKPPGHSSAAALKA